MKLAGKCLCGAVTYAAEAEPVFMGNCYCRDCQRESGTGHITAVAVPSATLTVAGQLTTFDKPTDRGTIIATHFCPACGTTLYTNPSALAGLSLIRAGTLDDLAGVVPQVNMFVGNAPAWDRPAPGLADFPGMAG